jgi:peptide/nickel transport system ATP-binding protein
VRAACGAQLTGSLALTERTRVMLARALARAPRLLVLDEPATMPNVSEREEFYSLLRSVAAERDVALLVASAEMAALQGFDVLMSIAEGELCSTGGQDSLVRLRSLGLAWAEGS